MRFRNVSARVQVAISIAVAAVAQFPSIPASAQQDIQIYLQHATRTVKVQVGDAPTQTIGRGEAVRIPSGHPAKVSLVNSNSALYSCKITQEPIAVPELDTLKKFLSAAGGYLPLVARGIAGAGGPGIPAITTLDQAARAVEDQLAVLDSLVDGSTGLQRARRKVVTSLSLMRLTPDSVDPTVPSNLRQWFQDSGRCADANCSHLTYPAELLAAFDALQLKVQELKRANMRAKPLEAQAQPDDRPRITESLQAASDLLAAADRALTSSQATLHDTYAFERLAVRTMTASSTVPCDVVDVSWDQGKRLTFNISPIAGDELEPIATRESYEYKLDVLPRWKIRPTLGLTFLAAPHANHPKYSASQADTGFKIVENGSQDSRFTYGLTLGLTYGPLDQRTTSGWAMWLPELTVNPLDDVKAVGIGAGISYGVVKLGFGRLFTRHTVLDGQRVGDIIQTADELRTRDTFGHGEWYVGISLIGLPPFVPGS